MRPTEEATADSLSAQSFTIIKTLDTGILLLTVFKQQLEIEYPSETGLCAIAPSPTDTPSPIFFWVQGPAVHRLIETDNPSSKCPSKLTDKVRRIVHSKLKPFPFQIKTYYLFDANYQTDNTSHTNNPSLVWKRPFLLLWWMSPPPLLPWVRRSHVGVKFAFLYKDYFEIGYWHFYA